MDYKCDPHSDDDFDSSNGGYGDLHSGYSSGNTRVNNPNGLSKAELRKTNKPIMEKRRRARINHCLNELKSLILEAMKKDPARHTKLEKADILEMTVKHLQSVQRQQLNMAIQTDPTVVHKFKTGFVECADEVNRYISQLDGVDSGVRQRLTSHLNNCATSLEQIGSMTNFNNGYRGQLNAINNNIFGVPLANPLITAAGVTATQIATPASATATATIFPPLPLDLNNNNHSNTHNATSNQGAPIQMGGMQLIPSRLPSGEFALIMPNPTAAVIAAGGPPDSLLSTTNPLPFPAAWPTPVVSAVLPTSQHLTTTATVQPPPLPLPPAAATTLNDFTTNFHRMSAFSKPLQKCQNNNNTSSPFTSLLHLPGAATVTSAGAPFHQPTNNLHQNSTAASSPPPSPISSAASVSSHGDDSSIMHTSSDFNTPSRPATPPQDAQTVQHNFSGVFNTPSSSETSLNSSRGSIHLQQQQVTSTSGSELRGALKLKRPHTEAGDSNDSSEEEPSSKKFASAEKLSNVATPVVSDEERDSMWRPW